MRPVKHTVALGAKGFAALWGHVRRTDVLGAVGFVAL